MSCYSLTYNHYLRPFPISYTPKVRSVTEEIGGSPIVLSVIGDKRGAQLLDISHRCLHVCAFLSFLFKLLLRINLHCWVRDLRWKALWCSLCMAPWSPSPLLLRWGVNEFLEHISHHQSNCGPKKRACSVRFHVWPIRRFQSIDVVLQRHIKAQKTSFGLELHL